MIQAIIYNLYDIEFPHHFMVFYLYFLTRSLYIKHLAHLKKGIGPLKVTKLSCLYLRVNFELGIVS